MVKIQPQILICPWATQQENLVYIMPTAKLSVSVSRAWNFDIVIYAQKCLLI